MYNDLEIQNKQIVKDNKGKSTILRGNTAISQLDFRVDRRFSLATQGRLVIASS